MTNINKDINSTEKLLNVIRGKDEDSFGAFGKQKISLTPNQPGNIRFGLPRKIFNQKQYTVGIDIGREFICMVKTAFNNFNQPVLADKKIIKINPQLSVDSPEIASLLKSSLVEFCGNVADCDIWTKISTAEVNVHFLKIPRVPDKQLEKVIFWTAKKEGFFDEEKHIFDFERQDEEVIDQGTPKYSVMVYSAPKREVEKIKSLFSDIGVTLAGITIVPFAMQNIFRSKWMPAPENIFASLFIGDDYSRIDIYNKENLIMTRLIKTGSNTSMAEAIASAIYEKTGGLKLDHSEAKRILYSIGPDTQELNGFDSLKDFTKEEILKMISPVWERLARQVDLTLKTTYSGNQKVEKIYILSSINFDKSILDYISDQLDTKTEFFDPFKLRKSTAQEESLSSFERILISPALGFALSGKSRTPNVIFTYREKNQETKSKRINRLVFVAFLTALVVCCASLFYQVSRLNLLKETNLALERELALFNPLISEETILQEVDKIKLQNTMTRRYTQRYFNLAAIGEVSDLTPQNVRLITLRMNEEKVAGQAAAGNQQAESNDIILEGIIFDKKDMLESDLIQYVAKLESSLLFNKVSVQQKNIVNFDKKDVLHFVLTAKKG